MSVAISKWAGLAVLCSIVPAQAAILTVGSEEVQPLLPGGSTIQLPVSWSGGPPAITGFIFRSIIDDDTIATPGPKFTGAANYNTTVWTGFSNTFSDTSFNSATAEHIDTQFLLQTSGDSSSVAGPLVFVTVDVSGLLPFTTYTVTLNIDDGGLIGSGENPTVPVSQINAGFITVVPEPATLGLAVLGGLALLARRRSA